MEEEKFEAFVQYNDLTGSVAADNADRVPNTITHWLEARELKTKEEWVIGIILSIGENHGEELVNPVSVTILLCKETKETVKQKIDEGILPLSLRRVSTVMKVEEFFSLFKRFNIALSPRWGYDDRKGILEGIQYQYPDEDMLE
jgi:hypothetical protein